MKDSTKPPIESEAEMQSFHSVPLKILEPKHYLVEISAAFLTQTVCKFHVSGRKHPSTLRIKMHQYT